MEVSQNQLYNCLKCVLLYQQRFPELYEMYNFLCCSVCLRNILRHILEGKKVSKT